MESKQKEAAYDLVVLVFIKDIQRRPQRSRQDGWVLWVGYKQVHQKCRCKTQLTGYNGELRPQIRQTNLRDVDAINHDLALSCFHKSEKG